MIERCFLAAAGCTIHSNPFANDTGRPWAFLVAFRIDPPAMPSSGKSCLAGEPAPLLVAPHEAIDTFIPQALSAVGSSNYLRLFHENVISAESACIMNLFSLSIIFNSTVVGAPFECLPFSQLNHSNLNHCRRNLTELSQTCRTCL